jgi:cytochrome c biogenesis protein CcdA
VFGLALLDSINPSALLVAILLLPQPRAAAKIAIYMSAVFCCYFIIGVLLMLGFGAALDAIGNNLSSPVAYGAQGMIGGSMLLYSLLVDTKQTAEKAPRLPTTQHPGTLFLLGVSVSAVEFATALPYLAAIGLLSNAGLPSGQWLPILLVYNLILVAPPLLLAAAAQLARGWLEPRLERWQARLQREARETLLWIVGIIGFFLLADAVRFFVAEG